jgi:hypothetical protein
MYSKLAVLELCGWLEEAIDKMILKCAKRKIKDNKNYKYIKDKIVDKNYEFDYEKHFRNMMVQIIGLHSFEKVENKMNSAILLNFKSTLGTLKKIRDSEAHTHLVPTRRIDAPSTTQRHFSHLYNGLIEFERCLKLLKL